MNAVQANVMNVLGVGKNSILNTTTSKLTALFGVSFLFPKQKTRLAKYAIIGN